MTSNPTPMTRFLVYFLISLFLSSCSYTKNWRGTSTSQVAQAEFETLHNKLTFVLRVPNNDTYLTYRFSETGGELSASIQSASERLFDQKIQSSAANSVHLVNQKGTAYTLTVEGRHASGAFDVRFTSSKE